MASRKRRIRSPHPGVKLKRRTLPSGRTAWRACYVDPATKREKFVTLDLVALPTHEARAMWAKRLSRELARKRMDLATGEAPRVEPKGIPAAIAEYRDAAKHRLRSRTLSTYNSAFEALQRWAVQEGIARTSDITAARVAALREHLIGAPKHAAKRGARRGARVATAQRRSAFSVNRDLRAIKTLLLTWRRTGLVPLSRDDITDTMKLLPTAREQPEFLPPAKIKALLEAVMRHDEATFEITRAEHAGHRPRGTTLRYPPIAPFTAFLLLTGCRRGEALALQWESVDLDAVDHEGRKVGEIRLTASATKTHRARTIGLEVSPALRKMLAAMRLASGGEGYVFGGDEPYTVDSVEAARKRLRHEYGAPKFDWQLLRSTCGTFLTNAPGIFGAATVFLSAKQLGHSVAVAERHYLGVHRGISRDAHSLEAAMQVEGNIGEITDRARSGRTTRAARLFEGTRPD